MLEKTTKEKVEERIKILIEQASQELNVIIPIPKVRYCIRGDNAGAADFNKWVVDFNPKFLKLFEEEFIHHTVGHEIAHFAAVSKHGWRIFPHGKEWQRTMRMFELPILITHDYVGPDRRTISRD